MKINTACSIILLFLLPASSRLENATAVIKPGFKFFNKQIFASKEDNDITCSKAQKELIPSGCKSRFQQKLASFSFTKQSTEIFNKKFQESMVLVEGGIFEMGSNKGHDDELPVHPVRLNSFYIGKYEVTQTQWEEVMGKLPGHTSNCSNCPVLNTSWKEVQEFLNKLNKLTGKQYRIPTEAEWEYAAKGGNKSKNYIYSGSNNLNDVAWYGFNKGDEILEMHEVGLKQPNEIGLYDMSGSVREFVSDLYDKNYYSASPLENPRGPNTGCCRILRGGSWDCSDDPCRTSNRFRIGLTENLSNLDFGFRLALDL